MPFDTSGSYSLPFRIGSGSSNEPTFYLQLGADLDDIATGINQSATGNVSAGYFQVNSTTQVAFTPKNGNHVQIGGVIYNIPAAGILAANTGVYVNSNSGQNLAASTSYLVSVFNNAGTPTLDFYTSLAHSPDATAGNVGVEIATGVSSRTVVGLVRTNGSSQFQDDGAAFNGCLSWFNRRNKPILSATGNIAITTSNGGANIAISGNVGALVWSEDAAYVVWTGELQTAAPATFSQVLMILDGNTQFGAATFCYAIATNPIPANVGGWGSRFPTAWRTYALWGGSGDSNTGTLSTLNGAITGMIRG